MEIGHILKIEHGKKKQIAYDVMEHVDIDWMDYFEADVI